MDIYIDKLKEAFSKKTICNSHGVEHAIQVMNNSINALQVCKYNLSDNIIFSIKLASLLHDADDRKLFPENKNNENARFVMQGLDNDIIELVIRMIDLTSSSKNGDNVPEDAKKCPWLLFPRHSDRLEAIGLIGIRRCYEFTKTCNKKLFDDMTIRITNKEDIYKVATIERYRSYKGTSNSMIDHFYDKLLRLGLFETDNEYYKKVSGERIEPLINFILEFGKRGHIDDEFIINYINNYK